MTASAQTIALNRFGLGARSAETAPNNPQAWLADQLRSFDPHPPAIAAAPTRETVMGHLADTIAFQAETRRERKGMSEGDAPPDLDQRQAMRKDLRQISRDDYHACVGARATAALLSPAPFAERLTHFWANHFAVSAEKLINQGLAGLLEFDAIRPNLMGTFSEMVLAVEQHPAMLIFLDQKESIGPNSRAGLRAAGRGRPNAGLNENLAREIMELHTLGVRTGYTQADVTELARALTGWMVSGMGEASAEVGNFGAFVFLDRLHEPGTRTVLGKRYAQADVEQARAIIADLCANPATATHIATKLARHFTADTPPASLVQRLAADFSRTRGSLPSLYRTLIASPEVWAMPPGKFKTPWDWVISSARGMGLRAFQGPQVARLLDQLGQPVWQPGSPAGYDDVNASWAGPDALLRRVEAAERLAVRAPNVDARILAPQLLAGTLTPATAGVIADADSPDQALALLLVAPEFMRR